MVSRFDPLRSPAIATFPVFNGNDELLFGFFVSTAQNQPTQTLWHIVEQSLIPRGKLRKLLLAIYNVAGTPIPACWCKQFLTRRPITKHSILSCCLAHSHRISLLARGNGGHWLENYRFLASSRVSWKLSASAAEDTFHCPHFLAIRFRERRFTFLDLVGSAVRCMMISLTRERSDPLVGVGHWDFAGGWWQHIFRAHFNAPKECEAIEPRKTIRIMFNIRKQIKFPRTASHALLPHGSGRTF